MPGKPGIDKTGETFGDWTIIGYSHRAVGTAWWRVRCKCGTERVHREWVLTTGKSTRCGECSTKHVSRVQIERQAARWVGTETDGWVILTYGGAVTQGREKVTMWACQCTTCGAVVDIPRTSILKPTMPVCRHGVAPTTDKEN